ARYSYYPAGNECEDRVTEIVGVWLQAYNSVAVTALHPASSVGAASVPQFGASGRKQQFMDSFAEGIDLKNNTQFHVATNQSAQWVLTARHAYNKPAVIHSFIHSFIPLLLLLLQLVL